MRLVGIFALALFAMTANGDGSSRVVGPVEQFTITSYPLYGITVQPDDSQDLPQSGFLRADGEGVVRVLCYSSSTPISLTVVAGEFVPCRVKRVYSTNTTATPLHLFY